MAFVLVFGGITREQYEESVRRLVPGKERVESAADWPVPGLLVHAAGEGPRGFGVVDVWESEDAFAAFGELLLPILGELGVEGEPEIYPAHTLITA